MSYKLQKYEEDVCSRLMACYDTYFDLAIALGYYKRLAGKFDKAEELLPLYIWLEIKNLDGGYLADTISDEFPNYSAEDIETLMCHAIKKTFRHTIKELIELVSWDDHTNFYHIKDS